jgi:hypothetical protein
VRKNPQYMKKSTPKGEHLYALLQELKQVFKECVCPKKNRPLFRKKGVAFFAKLEEMVLAGHLAFLPQSERCVFNIKLYALSY